MTGVIVTVCGQDLIARLLLTKSSRLIAIHNQVHLQGFASALQLMETVVHFRCPGSALRRYIHVHTDDRLQTLDCRLLATVNQLSGNEPQNIHCVPKKLDHQTHGGKFVKS